MSRLVKPEKGLSRRGRNPEQNGVKMEGTSQERDGTTPSVLPAHAALIRSASRLDGAPHKGWYFAVMVRAAYSRLEGNA